MATRTALLTIVCAIVSACTSGGASGPQGSSDSVAVVTTEATAATSPASPPDATPAPEPAPPDERSDELLARAGTIDLTVFAPDDLVDDVRAVVEGRDGDLYDSHCRSEEPFGSPIAERYISCDQILPGSYRVDVEFAGPVDSSVAIGSTCGNEFGGENPTAEVYVNGSAWCQLYVMRPTLQVSAHGESDSDWDPTVLGEDGRPAGIECERREEVEWENEPVTVVCTGIPLGTYELPPQPFADGSVDAPFVCSSLYGDEQTDGIAVLATGLNEFGVPLNSWDCHQEVTEDMLPGRIEFIASGTPAAARGLEPIILQNGVDVFPTNCELTEDFTVWGRGVIHRCDDLERSNVEVIIPAVDGARIQLRCDTALAYPSHREVTVDLVSRSTGYCTASRIQPTLAIIMLSEERRPEWNVDDFVIELPTGPVGIGWCEQIEVLDPTYAELWVYCSPVRDTTIVVPDQPVVVGGPIETFVCSVGIGLGAEPGSDNTATVAVVNNDGLVPDEWSCNNLDDW